MGLNTFISGPKLQKKIEEANKKVVENVENQSTEDKKKQKKVENQ